MDKNEDGSNPKANEFNIEEELTKLKNNKVLPAEVIEKIGKRIQQSKISFTKTQFYTLIDKIETILTQQNISTSSPKKITQNKSTLNHMQNTNIQTQNDDMKKLYDSVEQLREKIQYLEDNITTNLKEPSGITDSQDESLRSKSDSTPYKEMEPLTSIPNDTERIVVLMKWLQYLVEKIGKQKLPDILGYYVDINWITDDVRLDIMNYSNGIVDEQKEKEDTKKTTNTLSAKDHIQSLLYIQKLKGKKLDERFICKLDREMEKMIKSIDGYKC